MLTDERIDELIKRLYKRKSYLLFTLFGPEYLMAGTQQKIEIGRRIVRALFVAPPKSATKGNRVYGQLQNTTDNLKVFFLEDIQLVTRRSELLIYLLHPDATIREAAEQKSKLLKEAIHE